MSVRAVEVCDRLSYYCVPSAEVAELVDALVSNTSELCSCRFDPDPRYQLVPNI